MVAATYWMALQPGAADAQTAVVRWINDPPEPFGTVLAVTNSLLRPVPLAVVALALVGWIVFTARVRDRWEVLRAMLLAYALSEAITQILKREAEQPRPTASIAGLDVHGYPTEPHGHAYSLGPHECRRRPRDGVVALAEMAAARRGRGHRDPRRAEPPVHRSALAP